MHLEFRQAVIPDEIRKLMAFDRKVFPKADLFGAADWRVYDSYWMLVDGVAVGCCAFLPHAGFLEDLHDDDPYRRVQGSLYIASTGILPRFQARGLGAMLKCWQIAYAKYHGFNRIVTNTRRRNTRIISLNRKFGFKIVRTTPGYYSDPPDATVVMELRLRAAQRNARATP
jgi:ribosomal protein S18 acetylase RimI-like enzyme